MSNDYNLGGNNGENGRHPVDGAHAHRSGASHSGRPQHSGTANREQPHRSSASAASRQGKATATNSAASRQGKVAAANSGVPQASTAKSSKKKKIKGLTPALLAIGSFVLILVVGGICLFNYFFGGLNTKELNTSDLGIDSSYHSSRAQQLGYGDLKVTNIALFGIDARGGGTEGRSDAIIVLSINHRTNGIKLISVMRDSYVSINGKMDKITHAYAYGGPELAVKTLNENFKLDITEYVTVNFDQMAEVVDAIGGVNIDVSEAERINLNRCVEEINPQNPSYLNESGDGLLLDGQQAVGYARIRAIDSDQARTGRQREVLMAIFNKVLTLPVTQLPQLAKTVIPMVTTSFSYAEAIEYLPILTSGTARIEQTMVPGKYDNARDAMINEVYYMQYDLDKATEHIHDFIYLNIDPDVKVESASESSSSES